MRIERKIAVLDIGSNTVMTLVAHATDSGAILPVNEFGAITRLGEGVNQTRRLCPAAIERTLKAIGECMRILEDDPVDCLLSVATSAVRDAENRSDFLDECRTRFGISPIVLTGESEAICTFKGATTSLDADGAVVTVDVGGGSTEVCFGTRSLYVGGRSVNIGCVRLTEMFEMSQSFFVDVRIRLCRHIVEMLRPVAEDVVQWLDGRPPTVVCCGGTATTYAAVKSGLKVFDRALINKTYSTRSELAAYARDLGRMRLEARRKIAGMESERAEVLPAGMYIIATLLRLIHADSFQVSASGLRMGAARRLLDGDFG